MKSPLIQSNINGTTDEQSGSSVPAKLNSVLDTLKPNTQSLELDKKESKFVKAKRITAT